MVNSNLKTLCVDLDGTLVLTDCLHESIIQLLKQNLFYMFVLPIWVLHGKAYFKDQIAKRVSLTAEFLPYNNSVLNYIKKRKSNTVEVYLVTASHQSIADNIAKHLGIFSGQFGSDSKHNYKGNNKAEFLDKQFGKGQYEYIGNDSADLSVWRHSGVATVASNNNNLLKKAKALGGKVNHIPQKYKLSPIPYIKMMRVHQWVKNTLIFLPLVLAHSFTDVTKLLDAFFGFILFSFAASGIYIFNDLVDLNHDRAHPVKSKRPLASGMVPVAHGLIVGGLLWIIALSTAYVYFDLLFFFILGYIILNFAYSTIFKKLVLIDVVVLAGFYTIRIIIGSVITEVALSFWLLTFSLFVFFSLALVKRYSEIAFHTSKSSEVKGRGYHSEDEMITTILGVASGLISILVMALYINDPHTQELYSNENWLWLTIPALLYWMSRLWLLAHRNQITVDPIIFALKDVESYIIAMIIAFAFYMAI